MKSSEFWDWYDSYVVPRVSRGRNMDRSKTFRKMLEHLDGIRDPIIIETGCIERVTDEGWEGNGCSTLIFDKYVSLNGGKLYSVDIVPENVALARSQVGQRTSVVCSDSVKHLEYLVRCDVKPDLVYLDASHLWWHNPTPAQVHHYNELMAIMPKLRPTTLVAVDDTIASIDMGDLIKADIVGKGGLVAKYAAEVGAEMVFTEYQTGWVGFPGEPDNTDYNTDQILQRARAAAEKNKWTAAYELYKEVLARTPEPWNGVQRVMHGEACAYFARLALQVRDKRYGAAYDWYERSLRADPRAADYRMEFALRVLRPMGLMDMARDQAEKCTKIEPNDHLMWRALGLTEGQKGNIVGALAAHSKQLELSGRTGFSLVDVSSSLIDLEQYDKAAPLVAEALELDDEAFKPDALHCKAMIEARLDHHEIAIPLYKKAIEQGCHDPTLTAFHLALSQFSIGQYKEGWANQVKIEHNTSDPALYLPMRRFDRPLFNMQPAPAIVHVHAEAGAGDNIAMWRYFPLLVQKGYTVRYEIRSELLKVAQDSLKDVEVVPLALDYPGAVGLKHFDYHCPIGQLPWCFGTDIDTVPWNGPFVKADPELAKKYRGAPKIGIAWSSGVRQAETTSWLAAYGRHKSLSFELIRPIIEALPMYSFVSLQVGSPRVENDTIADLLPEKPTWADTAALIENIDLVITPDTGLAHLAGAMGKPTWIMMHAYNMGWHFMCERPGASWNERSPWYPSVRLFRQRRGEDWEPVVRAISAMLGLKAVKVA